MTQQGDLRNLTMKIFSMLISCMILLLLKNIRMDRNDLEKFLDDIRDGFIPYGSRKKSPHPVSERHRESSGTLRKRKCQSQISVRIKKLKQIDTLDPPFCQLKTGHLSHLFSFYINRGPDYIVCPTERRPDDDRDIPNLVIDVSIRRRGQSGRYFSGLSETDSMHSLLQSTTSSGYNSLIIYDTSSLAISGRQSDNPVLAAPRSLGSSGFGSGVVQETPSFPVSTRITPDFEDYDSVDENRGPQNPPQNENPLSCLEQIQSEERMENYHSNESVYGAVGRLSLNQPLPHDVHPMSRSMDYEINHGNESVYGAVGGVPLDQSPCPVVHHIPRSLGDENYSRDTVMLNQNLEATQIKEPVSDRLVPSKEEPANSSSNCQAPLPTQKGNRGIRSEDIRNHHGEQPAGREQPGLVIPEYRQHSAENQPFHDDNVDQSHGNRFGSFNQLHIDQRSSESSVEVVDDITQAPETENLESGLAETQGAVGAENLEIEDANLAAIHDDYLFGESQLRGGGEHESVEDCNGGEGMTDQQE